MSELAVVCGSWKQVVGHPEYEVSDLGQVRNALNKRLIRPFVNDRGYLKVTLRFGEETRAFVHRLVLDAFVGQCPDGMECAHLNGVRTDNRLENLSWVTPKENAAHKAVHGTNNRGNRLGLVKLDENTVREIRSRFKRYEVKRGRAKDNRAELAEEYGLHVSSVIKIATGQTWRDVV